MIYDHPLTLAEKQRSRDAGKDQSDIDQLRRRIMQLEKAIYKNTQKITDSMNWLNKRLTTEMDIESISTIIDANCELMKVLINEPDNTLS